MIRISVSDIDSYRYYRDNEDATLEDLLAKLRRQVPPTLNMLAGTALHAVLENATEGLLDVAQQDGHTFVFDIEQELYLPKIRELKAEMLLDTPSGEVTLVGKVDAQEGTCIHDHKLTERFDAERYADSMQWRSYLRIFGARKFQYNVFVGHEKNGRWIISEFHPLVFYAYPSMNEDVQQEVSEFAAFWKEHMK